MDLYFTSVFIVNKVEYIFKLYSLTKVSEAIEHCKMKRDCKQHADESKASLYPILLYRVSKLHVYELTNKEWGNFFNINIFYVVKNLCMYIWMKYFIIYIYQNFISSYTKFRWTFWYLHNIIKFKISTWQNNVCSRNTFPFTRIELNELENVEKT